MPLAVSGLSGRARVVCLCGGAAFRGFVSFQDGFVPGRLFPNTRNHSHCTEARPHELTGQHVTKAVPQCSGA